MAHDVRSPMESLETIKLEIDRSTSPLVQEIYNSSIKRIKGIVEEAQEEHNGYAQEQAKSNDIKLSVDTVLNEKARSLKNIHINSSIGQSFSALFVPKKLSRIISNVINNAAESYDENGGKIWLSISQDDTFAVLEVKDEGKGISEKHLPMLFQENFSFGKKGGQGIGLSTAKHWLESWGGFIQVDSALGKGTIVKIVLRNKLKTQAQPESEATV